MCDPCRRRQQLHSHSNLIYRFPRIRSIMRERGRHPPVRFVSSLEMKSQISNIIKSIFLSYMEERLRAKLLRLHDNMQMLTSDERPQKIDVHWGKHDTQRALSDGGRVRSILGELHSTSFLVSRGGNVYEAMKFRDRRCTSMSTIADNETLAYIICKGNNIGDEFLVDKAWGAHLEERFGGRCWAESLMGVNLKFSKYEILLQNWNDSDLTCKEHAVESAKLGLDYFDSHRNWVLIRRVLKSLTIPAYRLAASGIKYLFLQAGKLFWILVGIFVSAWFQ